MEMPAKGNYQIAGIQFEGRVKNVIPAKAGMQGLRK